MKKIVLLPLDERPCTYEYPTMLASMAKDIDVKVIPRNFLGDYKVPGDKEKISNFLLEESKDADYLVIAVDTLLYGGIVPSRLHYDSEETLSKYLDVLKEIKKNNPSIKIFAYQLIMRCPTYSSNSEEPDYYALCGTEIFNIGKYNHLKEVRPLNENEEKELQRCLKYIEDNNYQKYVDDYLNRRIINTNLNNKTVELVKDGIIDFLVIPQDDSAPYGLTAKDQMKVRKHIAELSLESKVLMYPDADAVSNTLLARAINEINNKKPLVYIRYATCNDGNIIPNYEDRPISESLKYQIMAAGGIYINDYSLSDIVLMVNLPLDNMIDARHLYDCLNDKVSPGEKMLEYTVGRNLVEFVSYIKYLVSIGKCVGVADVAYSNGSDTVLVKMLRNEGLLYKINGYAGWNTSANTIGTCLPLTMINKIYGTSQEFLDFMGLRYLEDCGYQSNVRHQAFDKFRNEFEWGLIDGKQDGKVATYIKENLIEYAKNELDTDEYKIELVYHTQPWNRFFETGIKVKVVKK